MAKGLILCNEQDREIVFDATILVRHAEQRYVLSKESRQKDPAVYPPDKGRQGDPGERTDRRSSSGIEFITRINWFMDCPTPA